ncbi:DUF2934 domain-containing protein [Thiorhodovibrio litoralis]|uniref:DUF2934 domain-containing protein n=2 Tax=Thiorhodovibrio TaxID=61593 RepID=UPI002B26097F|nr:DUF2934 domain-containing protein [Thiorhodovibrio litoralis]WPL11765.1 hypothetical protein Thiosp_01517 [Thiorhodovibrio litoralis]
MPFSAFSIHPDSMDERRSLNDRRQQGDRRDSRQGASANDSNKAEVASLRFASPPRKVVNRASRSQVNSRAVAEAAYFRAEKRGFLSGFETQDWLQAEKETLSGME